MKEYECMVGNQREGPEGREFFGQSGDLKRDCPTKEGALEKVQRS